MDKLYTTEIKNIFQHYDNSTGRGLVEVEEGIGGINDNGKIQFKNIK